LKINQIKHGRPKKCNDHIHVTSCDKLTHLLSHINERIKWNGI
jgi:hypothetical protein